MTNHGLITVTSSCVQRWTRRTTALALGSAMALLAGCGGSGGASDPVFTPTPTPSPNAPGVPSDFRANTINMFSWSSVANATRYEFFVDLDGAGPQAETQVDAAGGFTYSDDNKPTAFFGYYAANITDLVNATYRLRACNGSDCGAFSAAQTYDITASLSYAFSSGYAPRQASWGADSMNQNHTLSQDGLTLVLLGPSEATPSDVAPYVFARTSTTAPWQKQAVLGAHVGKLVLSADGNTLAVTGTSSAVGAVQIYHRNNGNWALETDIAATQTPPACPQPCTVVAHSMALSADGNVFAVTGHTSLFLTDVPDPNNAVFTYHRSGSTWTPIGYLSPGSSNVGSTLALSGDGRTLAINDDAISMISDTVNAYMHIYTQAEAGVWTQQARVPARVFNNLFWANPERSPASLSYDGSTLAVHGRNMANNPDPAFNIRSSDLTCGSPSPWNDAPGTESNATRDYIALFARTGTTWSRKAVMARNGLYWALAPYGSSLYYGGEVFKNNAGTWTCP